ncbi:hypothetical protein HAX54_032036 [Datura stramonium]|uniref:Uncharacterized protein n=1 Tax=Datura stramonium TaxID=4076 RepID=A0ABS8VDB4_DATST|nr:hypothetical protein [Datura stramonium]
MKRFVEQLGTFVDRAIAAALASYVSLRAHIEDMEARPKTVGKCLREGDEDKEKSQTKKHRKRKQERVDLLEAQRLSRAEKDMRLEEIRDNTKAVKADTLSESVTTSATIDIPWPVNFNVGLKKVLLSCNVNMMDNLTARQPSDGVLMPLSILSTAEQEDGVLTTTVMDHQLDDGL